MSRLRQAVWAWTGRTWVPARGTFVGLACDNCGAMTAQMYRKGGVTVCEECHPDRPGSESPVDDEAPV